MLESAARAQVAAAELALLTRAVKDRALLAMADALLDRREEILAANELDVRGRGRRRNRRTRWSTGCG